MTEALPFEINKQLNKLKGSIQSHNKKGDVYGLFSYHILNAASEWREEWEVLCDDDWVEKLFEENNVYSLSSLGYSVKYSSLNDKAGEQFSKAFDMLMQRDPFKGPHVSFVFQPITLIGLILGVKTGSGAGWKAKASDWLSTVIDRRINIANLSGYHSSLYNYARYLLDGSLYELSVDAKDISIEELSILEYTLRRGIFKENNQNTVLSEIRERLIDQLIKSDISEDADEKAAMIWIAVNESISTDISNYLLSSNFVSAILSRFEDAMKRWRYDSDDIKKPIRWPIESEREVQDTLWLVLRSYFEDLIDEEVLPKFGHKFHKPDFALPNLRLLIEVKYAYKKEDFKKIEQEIMIDTIAYLSKTQDYDKILVFIYDDSSSVQEHGTTKNDLIKLDEIEDVIIVSRPSQIIRAD